MLLLQGPWYNLNLTAVRTVLSKAVFVSHVVREREVTKKGQKRKEARVKERETGTFLARFNPLHELGLSQVVMSCTQIRCHPCSLGDAQSSPENYPSD